MAKQKRKLQTKRKRYDHKVLQSKMKEDPLVEALSKLKDFLKQYTQIIIAVVILVVFAVVGVTLYRGYLVRQEVEASRILLRAETAMNNGNMEQAQTSIDDLLKNYSSTTAAETARFMKAQMNYSTGNYDLAIQQYQDLLRKYKGNLQNEVKFSLANAYQSKGEIPEALRIYEELENKKDFPRKHELYYMKGLALETQGELDQAIEAYKNIPSDSQSLFYGLSRERLEWLRHEKPAA